MEERGYSSVTMAALKNNAGWGKLRKGRDGDKMF